MLSLRRIVQGIALIGFVALFLAARYPFKPFLPIDLGLRFSPFAAIADSLASWHLATAFWPGFLILLATPLLGRFFCGWLCPLGSAFDLWRRITGAQPGPAASLPRLPKVLLFVGLCFTAVAGGPFWGWFDPLALFNRLLTGVVHPIVSHIIVYISSFLEWIPGFTAFKRSAAKLLMPEPLFHPAQFWSLAALFLFFAVLEHVRPRFWCRSLCPAGALLGLCASRRLQTRRIDESCINCGACGRICPMDAVEASPRRIDPVECIECRLCDGVCPPGTTAIVKRFSFGPREARPIDLTRRRLLGSAACGLALAAGERILPEDQIERGDLIRPPGALDEAAFRQKCIRCLQCVRICASNGGCLQPDGLAHGLSGLWAPAANMRTGYCEYNCNLCGNVCPTGAIRRQTLTEKQKKPLGRAVFDKNFCIPHRRNEDCLVCEEHCPVPDKAIRFEIREGLAPDGTKHLVKYPYVVPDKCVGCGICEHKCPLPGRPGIFVANEKKL